MNEDLRNEAPGKVSEGEAGGVKGGGRDGQREGIECVGVSCVCV
jgi:hypothetical protein